MIFFKKVVHKHINQSVVGGSKVEEHISASAVRSIRYQREQRLRDQEKIEYMDAEQEHVLDNVEFIEEDDADEEHEEDM